MYSQLTKGNDMIIHEERFNTWIIQVIKDNERYYIKVTCEFVHKSDILEYPTLVNGKIRYDNPKRISSTVNNRIACTFRRFKHLLSASY